MSDRASTIREFCDRNRISSSTYFELRHKKKGPREMRVFGKVLITPEAEADWRHDRETPDPSDVERIERLRERGQQGGRKSSTKRTKKSGA